MRVARGDQAAFAGVYDRLAPVVLGLIRRVLRDPAQSEEVAQEVLVEVWRTASRYDPGRGSAAAWVNTTTRWLKRWRRVWSGSRCAAAWGR